MQARLLATAELEHFYDRLINIPLVAFGLDDEKGLYAVWGLAFQEGEWWAFFDIVRQTDNPGAKLRSGIRQVRKLADALGIVPKVVQNEQFETSARVCSLAGFEVVNVRT